VRHERSRHRLSCWAWIQGRGRPCAGSPARGRLARELPRPGALRERVAACLAPERSIPFHEQGLFRHYPEPDP